MTTQDLIAEIKALGEAYAEALKGGAKKETQPRLDFALPRQHPAPPHKSLLYDRSKIPAASMGGLEKMAPVTKASSHNDAVLVDDSGYGLEAVLVLHFSQCPRSCLSARPTSAW